MVDRALFTQSLLNELRLLQEARALPAGAERRFDAVGEFLNGLVEIGRVLSEDPELLGDADVELFRQESGQLLTSLHAAVDRYRANTAHDAYGVWEDVVQSDRLLRRRSALAFLGELYEGTAYEGFPDLLEFDELDDLIRDRGRSNGRPRDEEVPTGIPRSHWWWFGDGPRA